MRRVPWLEVLLFFVVATSVSAPFRLGLVDVASALSLPAGLDIFARVLRGIGPAVGYLVVRRLMHSTVPRTATFWGTSPASSACAALVLPACLALVGLRNPGSLPPHIDGLLVGTMLVLYALGEEYGWRGYLQPALASIRLPLRVLLIATLWYVWHLNFLNTHILWRAHLIHFVGLLLGSWGLLRVSEVTKSLLFVASVHLSFNLLFDVDAPGSDMLLVVGVAATVWTLLIVRLARSNRAATATAAPRAESSDR